MRIRKHEGEYSGHEKGERQGEKMETITVERKRVRSNNGPL